LWANYFTKEANVRLNLSEKDCLDLLPGFLDGYILRVAQNVIERHEKEQKFRWKPVVDEIETYLMSPTQVTRKLGIWQSDVIKMRKFETCFPARVRYLEKTSSKFTHLYITIGTSMPSIVWLI